MAQTQTQMKKTADKAKAPKAPKSDAELRAAFGSQTTRILSTLERLARKSERIMKKNKASEGQLEAFKKGAATLTERINRAARGETAAGSFTVPTE